MSWWRTGRRVLFAPARLWVGRGERANSAMLLAVNGVVVPLGASLCLVLGAIGNEVYDTFISSGGSMWRAAGAAKEGAVAGVFVTPCCAASVCAQVFITLSVLYAFVKKRCKDGALATAVLAHSSYPMALAALCGTAVYAAAVLFTATRWTATPSAQIELMLTRDAVLTVPVFVLLAAVWSFGVSVCLCRRSGRCEGGGPQCVRTSTGADASPGEKLG